MSMRMNSAGYETQQSRPGSDLIWDQNAIAFERYRVGP